MNKELDKEAESIKELIFDKSVQQVFRPKNSEICIEFVDGTRLFVNSEHGSKLEFSIT